MARFKVLTKSEGRRRWSEEQKRALVATAFARDANVSDVARRADLYPGQLYRWRRELQEAAGRFVEVVATSTAQSPPDLATAASIEVALDGGVRLRIPASIPPELAAAVLTALTRR